MNSQFGDLSTAFGPLGELERDRSSAACGDRGEERMKTAIVEISRITSLAHAS